MNWEMVAVLISVVTLAVGGLLYIFRLEGRLNVHAEKFNTVNAQFLSVDHRFLALEGSLGRIEAKLDRMIERRRNDTV